MFFHWIFEANFSQFGLLQVNAFYTTQATKLTPVKNRIHSHTTESNSHNFTQVTYHNKA